MIKVQNITYNNQGFSLLELMIVVAIIGILAAIAYPSYTRYVIKTKRTDMMTDLQSIANRIQAQKIASGSYTNIPLANVYGATTTNGTANFPTMGTALYTVKMMDNTGSQMTGPNMTNANWKLVATPMTGSMMTADGYISLDSTGIKCHNTTCGAGSEWNP